METKLDFHKLKSLYENFYGRRISRFSPLKSHGSDRKIVRIVSWDGNSCIGIINSNISENKAFIGFAEHFRKMGMKVPEIFSVSSDWECYLTEDLGDLTLLQVVSNNFDQTKISLYEKVIDELVKFQTHASLGLDYSLCYQFKEFGRENMYYDLNYFRTAFLDNFKIRYDYGLLEKDFSILRDTLINFKTGYFLYRDFQSRNIMIKNGELYFIDFQSGRKGALLYDIASLLYDAKANIPKHVIEELLEYYLHRISEVTKIDLDVYRNGFWYFALIRILQAMGAYGYLGLVKGKKDFLGSVEPALLNIKYVLSNGIKAPELKYLQTLFSENDFSLKLN